MKVKKLFGIALLAGSLLLSSCEDLLNNLMGGGNKKSKDNESSEKQGYQGKQGQTELSKEEWELAFSLEEFALRRNCHLQVTQDEREMNLDVDNGKFKIDVPTYAQYPFYMHFTGMSGDDIQGVQYYPNDDGTYSIHEDQEQLNLVMAEFGLIYLEYNSFTYDSSSKMYKADNYHYEITYKGQTALSLDCEDCEVTIEDGFPKKLECTIVEGADGDRSGVHYEANYSRYNAINVELPTVNSGGNSGNSGNNGNNDENPLPDVDGEEIPFELFYNEYTVRVIPNYTNVTATVLLDMGTEGNYSFSYTATKVDGVWTPNDTNSSQMDFNELIFDDEMMQELQAQINNQKADVKLYSASKGGFILTTSQEYEDDDGNMQMVDTQIYLNQYFYVTAEYISLGTVYEEIMIEWAA